MINDKKERKKSSYTLAYVTIKKQQQHSNTWFRDLTAWPEKIQSC